MAKQFHVLLVEDNRHDVRFVQRAWAEKRIANPLHVVPHGQACLDFLLHQGDYANGDQFPRPGIILMDIRMPVMDGIECLRKIRTLPDHKRIPVIILTTSKEEEDLILGYELGCNAFMQKPTCFEKLMEAVHTINSYWALSELPPI